MQVFWAMFKRDWVLAFRQNAEFLQPVLFCLLVVTMFPLGIGPSPQTLQKVGPGIIWVAALLASLLALEKLFKQDFLDGSLEQLILTPYPLPLLALAKITVHWVVSALPLLLLSPILALFLNLTWDMYWALLFTLLLGTPLMSLIGAIAVALTAGLNKGGTLLGLLLLPVYIPLLIFATATVESASLNLPYLAQLAIIAAMLLLALALAPFAVAHAIKVSQN
ncbi:heme exporter protein CcmB [Paraneptunicella aestuarii]|uniref:heme exporter protein CcmB n=1 Tax=Paraneptunicella aestuarii TaxID=2831148 RepID=UPI001E327F98|nr:heme exporter protein CcmB [Paraneptunicella aestuarii]UAA38136.1 heme exporter protein CcmB [Paraneptunicella aestuarii]